MKTKREILNEIENGRYVLNAKGQRLEAYSFRDALELAYNAGYSAARGNEDLLKLQKRQEKAARHGRRIKAERDLNKIGLTLKQFGAK